MSRHEGVSCDSCLKSNFSGRRYKCLICYDYDLCADCYEEGVTSTRHSADHPMQCILTRNDMELYFGGEMLNSEQPQSFTCPFCSRMGFSDSTLLEHVTAEHSETSVEVICPICAGLPGGEPNLVTDDFAGHLTLEHRAGPTELISFLDEPSAIRHGGGVRRIPGRTMGGPRSRRSNMLVNSSSGLSTLSPSGRDSVDPIAELLSQLSGVRRGNSQTSTFQQIQMQIQLERQQVAATRQQLQRLPRRPHPGISASSSNVTMQEIASTSTNSAGGSVAGASASTSGFRSSEWTMNNASSTSIQQSQSNLVQSNASSLASRELPINTGLLAINEFGLSSSQLLQSNSSVVSSSLSSSNTVASEVGSPQPSQFLLSKFMTPSFTEEELERRERERADRSLFTQALLLSTLANFKVDSDWGKNSPYKPKLINTTDSQLSELNDGGGSKNETTDEKHKVINNKTETTDKSYCDQEQQTSPEDFVEEYSLQVQASYTSNNSVIKKKQSSSGGKSGSTQVNPTASALTYERRGRPPPPPATVGVSGGTTANAGNQQQQPGTTTNQPQQGSKLTRDIKTSPSVSTTTSSEFPESR